ncbi:endoglucanase 4-like isoform X2 [Gigantopelta aegis]|uniref:endoglucanase 4-like isoform X2 n=1 Tax=Gigantopelta aegis TaxID=1735272 RepID=UPI001B88A4B6|nr:endoglucanase 4-like isoform X2 [Gigantopelta aegis]
MRLLISSAVYCVLFWSVSTTRLTVTSHWPGGYTANMCITSSAPTDCGWRAEVEFQPSINLEIWAATIASSQIRSSSSKFSLIHKESTDTLNAGTDRCFVIVARVSGNQDLQQSDITFTGSFVEICNPGHSSYSIPESWHGGFIGKLCMTTTTAVCGWQVTMTFSPAITRIKSLWDGNVHQPSSGYTVVVDDAGYNRNIEAGGKVCFGFDTAINGVHVSKSTMSITGVFSKTGSCDPTPGRYNYKDVLHKSILFYEAQRSGVLPQNNRIPWRDDSAVGDQSPNGRDLSGGWYDAGDFVKFNLPMAFSTTTLLWGLIRFKDGYVASGELANMYDSIRWPLDYFIKCWDEQNKVYWAQVGDANADHNYWGRPEDMTIARPAFSVSTSSGGSEVSAETAAALAAGSIAFSTEDPAYSATLLSKAVSLYDFAYSHRGTYTNSVPASPFYTSYNGYNDELCWGAAWLYKATGDATYIQKAHEFAFENSDEFSWDGKIRGCQVLLYEIAKERNDVTNENTFRTDIDTFLTAWMPGGSIQQTQCGLSWIRQWGPLRYAANTALIALIAAEDGIKTTSFRAWATKQINFMLGDNLNHRSYVVGFGNNPPVRPHHSSSSCPDVPAPCGWNEYSSPGPNPQTLHGALVGGPALNESYQDVRSDYIQNEVACDYNAGFQSSLAGLIHLEDSSQLPAVTPPSGC